jgi:predicted transcriptional regulator
MKLETYLNSESISVPAFADCIGVARQTVYSYIRREKIPSHVTMKKIVMETRGKVSPDDFYDLEGGQC